jgi:hypothetical protein
MNSGGTGGDGEPTNAAAQSGIAAAPVKQPRDRLLELEPYSGENATSDEARMTLRVLDSLRPHLTLRGDSAHSRLLAAQAHHLIDEMQAGCRQLEEAERLATDAGLLRRIQGYRALTCDLLQR